MKTKNYLKHNVKKFFFSSLVFPKDCMDLHYIAKPWTLKYHTNIVLQVFCKNIILS